MALIFCGHEAVLFKCFKSTSGLPHCYVVVRII